MYLLCFPFFFLYMFHIIFKDNPALYFHFSLMNYSFSPNRKKIKEIDDLGIQTMIRILTVITLYIGPTSFAPVIDAAVDIVERSNGQYHVLVIIADGQVLPNYVILYYLFMT